MPTQKKTFPPIITHPNSAFSKLHRVREEIGHLVITLKGFTPQATSKNSETCLVCSIAFMLVKTKNLPSTIPPGQESALISFRQDEKTSLKKRETCNTRPAYTPPTLSASGRNSPLPSRRRKGYHTADPNTPRADLSGFPHTTGSPCGRAPRARRWDALASLLLGLPPPRGLLA